MALAEVSLQPGDQKYSGLKNYVGSVIKPGVHFTSDGHLVWAGRSVDPDERRRPFFGLSEEGTNKPNLYIASGEGGRWQYHDLILSAYIGSTYRHAGPARESFLEVHNRVSSLNDVVQALSGAGRPGWMLGNEKSFRSTLEVGYNREFSQLSEDDMKKEIALFLEILGFKV